MSKLSHHLQTYQRLRESTIATRTLSDLPWPQIDPSEWEGQSKQQEIAAHEEIARLIPAIISGKRDPTLPDYRGQFIQVVADDLLQRMMDGDADVGRNIFPLLWVNSFALFDALRPTAPSDASHVLENELHIASAPIIDVMELSGYALLLSEYHQKSEIWTPVENVWKVYLDKTPGAIKLLAAIVGLENIRFQIPHRGIIRSQWSISIHQLLATLPTRRTGWYSATPQIEHPSPLVRYAGQEDWTDGLDVFVGGFLALFPDSKDLDWGFHRPNDFAEGVQREKEHKGIDEDEDA